MAVTPSNKVIKTAQVLKGNKNEYGLVSLKLKLVDKLTRVINSGVADTTTDVPVTIYQGGSSAKIMLQLFSGKLYNSKTIVEVDFDTCKGCGLCLEICPYSARYVDIYTKKAGVRDVLCQGCGICVAACSIGATQLKNVTKPQLLDMIDSDMMVRAQDS